MRIPKCQCARCMLYVRATKSEDPDYDLFEEDGITKKVTIFETRDYQTALIEIAKKRNIIACLPTGSGKTYIAFKLVEHFQDDIISTGKKVIFLANTIPLVSQQAEFFARNSLLKVKHLTGDMEVDYWSEEKWGQVVDGFQILAMTTQIFLNIIQPAFIKFSQIVLIIFDECHHAVKDHPMKLVMQKYQETKKMEPSYPLPRILGLTATIIKGNCSEWEVPARVEELERTMHAKAITYRDYETVLRHSTSSRIEKYRIPVDPLSFLDEIYCLDTLQLYAKELNQLRKERKKLKMVTTIDGIDASLRNTENVYTSLRKPTPGDLRIAVDDVKYCCSNLGPYCGVIAINLKLAFIEFSLLDLTDGVMKDWYQKVRKLFISIKSNLENWMSAQSKNENEKVLLTSGKLRQLVDIVKKQFGMGETPPCLFDDETGVCGLVFVDRRVTAQVVAWYLKDLASSSSDYSFIRANFVVGTSRSSFESAETRIYSKKQRETIDGFRTKKYNLLVATSVLEEGIDVPSCNLIVRFDKIPTYTSYIQSMGRARKPNALFCALIDTLNFTKESGDLDTFRRINEAMVRHLIANVEKVDEALSPMVLDHNVEPFCPGGTADSPSVTLESGMDVVDGYCNLLPCDGISTLQTLTWWSESRDLYRGHLKFPMNAGIRETVIGESMSTKGLARQAVYFAAAKKLYEIGVLDNTLLPVRPALPDKIDAFFKGLTSKAIPDEDEEGEVAEKPKTKENSKFKLDAENSFEFNATWYPKRIPRVFLDASLPRNLSSRKVYRICFDLTEPTLNKNYQFRNIYNFQKGFGYAIVTYQDIPDVGSFPLYGGFGVITASLLLIPNFPVRTIPFDASEFQGFIFGEILGLSNRLIVPNRDCPFFIIPIIQERNERTGDSTWNVDVNLLKDIVSFTGVSRTKRPNEEMRRQRRHYPSMEDHKRKFTDAVVSPWYKKCGSKLIYCVDTVEEEMTPNTPFHNGFYNSYKSFIESEYKTRIYDVNQPLLKTKLAGVGKGSKQLNYLLEKYSKEDEFAVRLVPELVTKLPISVSSMVQLKLLPSFLHRLYRLLLAREVLVDISERCDWAGILNSASSDLNGTKDDVNRLTAEQDEKRIADKKRRDEFQERLRKAQKEIPQTQHIENRDLHYEFIHPNRITMKDIQLFHEAISDQHAAKKLIAGIDPTLKADGVDNDSKIVLTPMEDLNLVTLEPGTTFESQGGPSALAVMEALTVFKSNDGVSNSRLYKIGWSFLNYVVSRELFLNYPSDWSEPILCQLRNRILSIQYLVGIAKKRNLAELLSSSDFYPTDTWLPPGFKLIPTKAGDVGKIAAEHKVPLRVYDALEIPALLGMTHAVLDNYVRTETPKYIRIRTVPGADAVQRASSRRVRPKPPMTGGIYSSYSHTEISDPEIAQGLCALIGAFFIKCGTAGAMKVLDWLEFRIPDVNGKAMNISMPILPLKFGEGESMDLNEVNRLLPHASALERKLGYTFVNRKLLLEALTHPTFLANNITDCYQRLEFLGDAILDALFTTHVFGLTIKKDSPENSKYTTLELTEVRASLVNNITYASLAVRYGLHKHLLSMSKALLDMIDNFVVYQEASSHEVVGHFTLISDEEVWGPKHFEVPKVLGDIFEALAGAIYIDSGGSLDTVWKVFYRLMEHEIDGFSNAIPKSPIQELYAGFPGQIKFAKWTSKKLRARGRDAMKITVGPHGSYFGAGTNITRAREAAAKVALKMIKEEDLFIKDRDASKIMMLC